MLLPPMILPSPVLRSSAWILAGVLLPGAGTAAPAPVDAAHALILKVAGPHVEDGFTLRADYWHGQVESAKQRLIRHQLFRGNEYWFWVATGVPGCKISLEIYNTDGEPVSVEKRQDAQWAAVRATPAQTGSYYVLLKIESLTEPLLDWALVYGYR